MANIDLDWDVAGIIQADESVRGMLQVIDAKGKADSGTFWCWDGRVSCAPERPSCKPATDACHKEHPW